VEDPGRRDGRRRQTLGRAIDTYRRQLDNHVLPALGEVGLGEATTPLVDKVISAIKTDTGASVRDLRRDGTGRPLRRDQHESGREVEQMEVATRKNPRALSDEEIAGRLAQLRADGMAVRKDLPDLSMFMLASGARIGEALALIWDEVDLNVGQVEMTHTIIRVKGEGLLRKRTKSKAAAGRDAK
jgi:integrase